MHMLCYLLLAAGMTSGQDAVLLEFTRPQCALCQSMQPAMARLQREGIAVRHVDVSQERHLAQRYRVSSYPTYIILSGGREISRLHGAQSIDTLRQSLAAPARPNLRNTGARTTTTVPMEQLARNVGGTSESMPSIQMAHAVERAQAATVRLRVREAGSIGIATGTVIDTHGTEALVLTCGHVFRDSKGQAPIEVDVYSQGRITTVPGQLIDFDADTRDIALVSIKPSHAIEPVPVVSIDQLPVSGVVAFSFGCDRGDDPTRRDTRVTAVNKYNQHIKASNLEIEGAPTIGRSGGGLFDSHGRIMGVCNAADFEDNIGIYAGPGAIHWQLDRINMAHLYAARPTMLAAQGTGSIASGGPPAARLARAAEAKGIAPTPIPVPSPVAASAGSSNQEVIVILRDKNRPDTPTQIKTFAQPPAEIMKLLGHR